MNEVERGRSKTEGERRTLLLLLLLLLLVLIVVVGVVVVIVIVVLVVLVVVFALAPNIASVPASAVAAIVAFYISSGFICSSTSSRSCFGCDTSHSLSLLRLFPSQLLFFR